MPPIFPREQERAHAWMRHFVTTKTPSQVAFGKG